MPPTWWASQGPGSSGLALLVSKRSDDLDGELEALGESLAPLGIEVRGLQVNSGDEVSDGASAADQILWHILNKHVVEFGQQAQEDGDCLWLIDAQGQVQALAFPDWPVAELQSTCKRFLLQKAKGAERGLHGGRWFHGAGRDLKTLSSQLRAAGFQDWADFYGG